MRSPATRGAPRSSSLHGEIDAALAPLPVEALRLEPEIVTLLKRLGLKRIGQLYALPRTSLERRFHAKETAEAVLLSSRSGARPPQRAARPSASLARLRGAAALPRATHHP